MSNFGAERIPPKNFDTMHLALQGARNLLDAYWPANQRALSFPFYYYNKILSSDFLVSKIQIFLLDDLITSS